MALTLQEVMTYLKENKYILLSKGMWYLSNQFQQDVKPLSPQSILPMNVASNSLATVMASDWTLSFITFIRTAKVPQKLEGSNGVMYDVNKYSELAMKEFKRMIEVEKIDPNILLKATQLYYGSSTGFKKKIGNYIIDGDWRSDYMNMKLAMETGEKQLTEHIKNEIRDVKPPKFRY